MHSPPPQETQRREGACVRRKREKRNDYKRGEEAKAKNGERNSRKVRGENREGSERRKGEEE
jgi:hypothetical protein